MELTLSEKLMLLALDDEKGHAVSSVGMAINYAVAGAVFFELSDQQWIIVHEKGAELAERAGSPDGVYAVAWKALKSGDRKRPIKSYIQQIAGKAENIKTKLLEALVEKGVLRKEEHRFLWIIPYDRYPTENQVPETRIRSHLRHVIRGEERLAEEDFILLSLVHACNLEKEVFSKEQWKEAKKKIELIARDERIGKAVSRITSEIEAAVTASIVAATAAATT